MKKHLYSSYNYYSNGFAMEKKKVTTRMGFEPTHAERNGLAVHRLRPLGHPVTWCQVYFITVPSCARGSHSMTCNENVF